MHDAQGRGRTQPQNKVENGSPDNLPSHRETGVPNSEARMQRTPNTTTTAWSPTTIGRLVHSTTRSWP
jgi:hypothetical protein